MLMQKANIIYIEDDLDFTEIVERAFSQVNEYTRLTIFDDGKLALNKLNDISQSKEIPRLILLDMNLPGISGLDVLKRIKENHGLRCVPVIMFSTSENPKDIKLSLENGANAYVTKPLGYLNLLNCVKSMYSFWLDTATYAC